MHTNSDTIFRLFHMAWSNLFLVLALKTLKWKFLIGCWRISTNEKMVSQPTTSKIWITPYEKAWKTMLTNGVQLVCIFLKSPLPLEMWRVSYFALRLWSCEWQMHLNSEKIENNFFVERDWREVVLKQSLSQKGRGHQNYPFSHFR